MTPPRRRRTFRRTFRKKFLGHFKKNIVQRNVAEKKILASNWGLKKNSCTEKLPNTPPQISNGPSLRGGQLEIPGGEGGIKFLRQDYFQSHVSAGIFFNAFNLCTNFFQDYLYFAVCLHEFFFSDVMAARIFFQAFFFAQIFWGEFSPPSRDF